MKRVLITWLLSLLNLPIYGMPQVIATVGPTVSITAFLKNIDFGYHHTVLIQPHKKISSLNLSVHTQGLSPGIVPSRTIKARLLSQPIYIIGDDDFSKAWLKKYARQLKMIHAVGFIVNVDSNEKFKALEKHFDLTLIPINGSAIMKRFDVMHYPVLISQHRIEQ